MSPLKHNINWSWQWLMAKSLKSLVEWKVYSNAICGADDLAETIAMIAIFVWWMWSGFHPKININQISRLSLGCKASFARWHLSSSDPPNTKHEWKFSQQSSLSETSSSSDSFLEQSSSDPDFVPYDEPHLIEQPGLTKQNSELLASQLLQWNLLAKEARVANFKFVQARARTRTQRILH